jgi:hypothetical protein
VDAHATPSLPVLQIRLARDAFSPGPLAIIVWHREGSSLSSSREARALVRPGSLGRTRLVLRRPLDASETSWLASASPSDWSGIRFSGAISHLTRVLIAQRTTEEHRGRFQGAELPAHPFHQS